MGDLRRPPIVILSSLESVMRIHGVSPVYLSRDRGATSSDYPTGDLLPPRLRASEGEEEEEELGRGVKLLSGVIEFCGFCCRLEALISRRIPRHLAGPVKRTFNGARQRHMNGERS